MIPESKTAHMLIEVALVLIVGGKIKEQLLRLELLARDKGRGHGRCSDRSHHRSLSTPVRSIGHR